MRASGWLPCIISSQGNPLSGPIQSTDRLEVESPPDLSEEKKKRTSLDEPAITCLSHSEMCLSSSTACLYIYNSISTSASQAQPLVLYLRIEQAVLQLSLGKLTGLGGGGAGGV
jgi:hypothetical protein